MKAFEAVIHEEPSFGGRTYRARFVVLAGVPTARDGLVAFAPGVSRDGPVIVISQHAGDGKTGQGASLQGVTAKDARALAAMLLEAAEEIDPTPCPVCQGSGKVRRLGYVSLSGGFVERSCAECRGSGRLFRPDEQSFAVPAATEDLQDSKE